MSSQRIFPATSASNMPLKIMEMHYSCFIQSFEIYQQCIFTATKMGHVLDMNCCQLNALVITIARGDSSLKTIRCSPIFCRPQTCKRGSLKAPWPGWILLYEAKTFTSYLEIRPKSYNAVYYYTLLFALSGRIYIVYESFLDILTYTCGKCGVYQVIEK